MVAGVDAAARVDHIESCLGTPRHQKQRDKRCDNGDFAAVAGHAGDRCVLDRAPRHHTLVHPQDVESEDSTSAVAANPAKAGSAECPIRTGIR